MAWTVFLAFSFACGLAMLGYGLVADRTGWNSLNVGLQWLVVLLPIASVLILAVLCGLVLQARLQWTAAAALVVFLAATQTGMVMEFDAARHTMAFMPAALMVVCVASLASKTSWMAWASPALAIAGLVILGTAAGMRASRQ